MSASLVGSEMCIRDRHRRAPWRRRGGLGLKRPGSWATASGWPRCARGPVSYTHLTLPTICSV
eukprot:3479325-Alexandrium_andersonii.AAC.1